LVDRKWIENALGQVGRESNGVQLNSFELGIISVSLRLQVIDSTWNGLEQPPLSEPIGLENPKSRQSQPDRAPRRDVSSGGLGGVRRPLRFFRSILDPWFGRLDIRSNKLEWAPNRLKIGVGYLVALSCA
jgi:hypothetical protein